jgi:hypothetical protein
MIANHALYFYMIFSIQFESLNKNIILLKEVSYKIVTNNIASNTTMILKIGGTVSTSNIYTSTSKSSSMTTFHLNSPIQ